MGGWLVADDDEKVRRGSGVGGLVQVKSGGVGLEVGRWRWCSAISGANHWRCLEARQAGRQAGKDPRSEFEAACDAGCGSAATAQANRAFAIWPKEVLLGSDKAEETVQDKNARDCSGGERKVGKDGKG